MFVKTFEIAKNNSYTFDWSKGYDINGVLFRGPFVEWQITYIPSLTITTRGILWFEPDKKTQITAPTQDNSYPLFTNSFIRFSQVEQFQQERNDYLNKFQCYVQNVGGYISFIIWITRNDYKAMLRR